MLPLILASSSTTRKELLLRCRVPYQTISPDIDETPQLKEQPEKLALRLAETKARKVASQFSDSLIISADQVIMCEDVRLDKPGTIENAVKQLRLVSGKKIGSYTGLCLFNSNTGHCQLGIETYEVGFRKLSEQMIKNYINIDQPFHCAGSIKAEGIGITLFTYMKGRDPTALLGLPLMLLTEMFLKEGINLLENG
jgi:septum formation protein